MVDKAEQPDVIIPPDSETFVPEFIAAMTKANLTPETLIALAEQSRAPADENVAEITALQGRVAALESALSGFSSLASDIQQLKSSVTAIGGGLQQLAAKAETDVTGAIESHPVIQGILSKLEAVNAQFMGKIEGWF